MNQPLSGYFAKPGRYACLLLGLMSVLLVCFVLSLKLGAVSMTWRELAEVVSYPETVQAVIVRDLRLPRTLMALTLGALLAVSGVASQGLFRNPLADPSLIGVSAGAALGAGIAIVLLPATLSNWLGLSLVPFSAFVAALVTVYLVYRLARGPFGVSVATLLLAGIAMAFLAGSATTMLEYFADHQMLRQLSLWRMGGLSGVGWPQWLLVATVALPVTGLVLLRVDALDALLLGEANARYLGVDVRALKIEMFIGISAALAACVALVGPIVFVGLVIPHIARAVVGPRHRTLVPVTVVLGAIFLAVADLLGRALMAPTELPAGLVVSMIGAPVFLYLLRQRYQFQV